MTFSIDQFNANINNTGGLAQKSQSMAVVQAPEAVLTQDIGIRGNHFPMRIEGFEYPSRSVVPIEYRDYGPVRPIGGQANFTEVNARVIMSSDFREREFFMRWQDMIVGNHRNLPESSSKFDVGYFDDYRSDGIEIRQYNQITGDVDQYTYRVMLMDAFPSAIGSMDTDWSAGDEVQKMNVTFTYRYFTEEYKPFGFTDYLQAKFFDRTDFNNAVLGNLTPQQRSLIEGGLRTPTFLEAINAIGQ